MHHVGFTALLNFTHCSLQTFFTPLHSFSHMCRLLISSLHLCSLHSSKLLLSFRWCHQLSVKQYTRTEADLLSILKWAVRKSWMNSLRVPYLHHFIKFSTMQWSSQNKTQLLHRIDHITEVLIFVLFRQLNFKMKRVTVKGTLLNFQTSSVERSRIIMLDFFDQFVRRILTATTASFMARRRTDQFKIIRSEVFWNNSYLMLHQAVLLTWKAPILLTCSETTLCSQWLSSLCDPNVKLVLQMMNSLSWLKFPRSFRIDHHLNLYFLHNSVLIHNQVQ